MAELAQAAVRTGRESVVMAIPTSKEVVYMLDTLPAKLRREKENRRKKEQKRKRRLQEKAKEEALPDPVPEESAEGGGAEDGLVFGAIDGDFELLVHLEAEGRDVSGAFPSLLRSVLTEIYLCHACSCRN
eukprot:SAG25_NODE_3943_length_923_cov_7.848301_1_plen_130_part_00